METEQNLEVVPADRAGTGAAELFATVYEQLRAVAAAALSRERAGHTLQPTALVHEAFLRLQGQTRAQWRGPEHFLSVASVAVRRVLIDHARARLAGKRTGPARRVVLSDDLAVEGGEWTRWIELDDALTRLSAVSPRQGRVVELKVFGGMTNDQIAASLSVSRATVASDWTVARAWMSREVLDRDS